MHEIENAVRGGRDIDLHQRGNARKRVREGLKRVFGIAGLRPAAMGGGERYPFLFEAVEKCIEIAARFDCPAGGPVWCRRRLVSRRTAGEGEEEKHQDTDHEGVLQRGATPRQARRLY
jgi:hypothetical protein